MYRKIILLIITSLFLYAEKIEINAKSFEGNQNNRFGVFKDVKIKQGEDFLNCKTLEVKLDKNNKITSYTANYVDDFSLNTQQKTFKGKSDKIIYNVDNNTYELIGNVKIYEDAKQLEADYLIINQKTGTYKIKSKTNKPVKLIFEIAK